MKMPNMNISKKYSKTPAFSSKPTSIQELFKIIFLFLITDTSITHKHIINHQTLWFSSHIKFSSYALTLSLEQFITLTLFRIRKYENKYKTKIFATSFFCSLQQKLYIEINETHHFPI